MVGAAICRELVRRGIGPVVAVGRSARPGGGGPDQAGVEYVSGVDALKPEAIIDQIRGVEGSSPVRAVVISIGLPPWIMDKDRAMQFNGLTNVNILRAAAEHKVPRVVLVNATMPSWSLIQAYRDGKMLAEAEALKYPEQSGSDCRVAILKPSTVAGTRYENGVAIPLGLILAPMRLLFRLCAAPCRALEKQFPSLFGGVLRPAITLEELSAAAADAIAAEGDVLPGVRVLGTDELCGYK